MRFGRKDLDRAVGQGVIEPVQADALWRVLQEGAAETPRFSLVHIAYYAGALLVIGAMGWFMGLAWEGLGGVGIFIISGLYAAGFFGFGWRLWHKPGSKVLGGLLVTIAVAMTPLATHGLQRWLGVWAGDDPGSYKEFHIWIRSGWFTMEVATLIAGLLALKFVRFPFLTITVAFTLWYMSMDLTSLIAGGPDFDWGLRRAVSMWFGLAMILVAYLVDRRTDEDFAFWGYLFGLIAFWGGLTAMHSDSEVAKLIYFLINIALIGAAVFLHRRAFAVFGAMGVFLYVGHLAWDVFEDSHLFPFALTGVGIAVIYMGVVVNKHGSAWQRAAVEAMPPWLRRLRPEERG